MTTAVLMGLLHRVGCVEAPGEVVGHPGVHSHLPCFVRLNGKVVYFTPGFQDFHFLPVFGCVFLKQKNTN